jgi:hypothetical protein
VSPSSHPPPRRTTHRPGLGAGAAGGMTGGRQRGRGWHDPGAAAAGVVGGGRIAVGRGTIMGAVGLGPVGRGGQGCARRHSASRGIGDGTRGVMARKCMAGYPLHSSTNRPSSRQPTDQSDWCGYER